MPTKIKAKPKTPPLDHIAAFIAADLLGDGDRLHVITKEGKHTGTWLMSNLTNALSARLNDHIELI